MRLICQGFSVTWHFMPVVIIPDLQGRIIDKAHKINLFHLIKFHYSYVTENIKQHYRAENRDSQNPENHLSCLFEPGNIFDMHGLREHINRLNLAADISQIFQRHQIARQTVW